MIEARRSGCLILLFLFCIFPAIGHAERTESFADWLTGVKAEAVAKGMRADLVESSLSGIQPIDRVLELDRRQPEFSMSFDDYLARVVSAQRVKQGRALMERNRALLSEVSARYGVPARVIVAMWGIESDFGRLTGGFSIIPALATLAYDGRRSQYFRTELMNALTMIDSGKARPEDMRGSWAGAMGQCQFMPSTYLKHAVSWNGNGHPDIWKNQADVFASAANYLSGIGWKADESWGRPVRLPQHGIAPSLLGLDSKRSVREWGRLGVRAADGKPLPNSDIQASLIRPETGKENGQGAGRAYLVYDNFRVIMKWNRSTFFALAAGTLADRVASK